MCSCGSKDSDRFIEIKGNKVVVVCGKCGETCRNLKNKAVLTSFATLPIFDLTYTHNILQDVTREACQMRELDKKLRR